MWLPNQYLETIPLLSSSAPCTSKLHNLRLPSLNCVVGKKDLPRKNNVLHVLKAVINETHPIKVDTLCYNECNIFQKNRCLVTVRGKHSKNADRKIQSNTHKPFQFSMLIHRDVKWYDWCSSALSGSLLEVPKASMVFQNPWKNKCAMSFINLSDIIACDIIAANITTSNAGYSLNCSSWTCSTAVLDSCAQTENLETLPYRSIILSSDWIVFS